MQVLAADADVAKWPLAGPDAVGERSQPGKGAVKASQLTSADCCPASARSPSAVRSGTAVTRQLPSVTVPGLALVVDEFALLLDLKDVYWARQGRISVDVGVGGIALAGSYFAALPVLRRLRRER